MRIACLALLAAAPFLHGQDAFEIRGSVAELGSNIGIFGAQVTLYQFSKENERSVFGMAATDGTGAFLFHPDHDGTFYVEAAKAPYVSISTGPPSSQSGGIPTETGTVVVLSRDHPVEVVRLNLMRSAELSGHVVDENGQPWRSLNLELLDVRSDVRSPSSRGFARTGADGKFTFAGINPGRYQVRLSTGVMPVLTDEFTEADLTATDDEVNESSYWPGVRDAAAGQVITVSSGVTIDLGTLRSRKAPLYRVHVTMPGCEASDRRDFAVLGANGMTFLMRDRADTVTAGLRLRGCQDFLVRKLPRGSYQFQLQSPSGWALAAVDIVDKNVSVSLTLNPEATITGSLRMVDDSGHLPDPGAVKVTLTPTNDFPFPLPLILRVGADGRFATDRLRWPRQRVIVAGLQKGYYVQEVRMGGIAYPDRSVPVAAGSHLEIVLDNQPGMLTGTVSDHGKPAAQARVYAVPWPIDTNSPRPVNAKGDREGRFQVGGLPPGEYRVIALATGTLSDALELGGSHPEVWEQAESITLERGKVKDVALELNGPQ